MGRERGELVYKIYRTLTYALSPMINLHLRWRKFRGLEHPKRWPERLGRPSLPRPAGPLVWFHAVSLGEGLAAIPVVKCCVRRRPDVTVLMTSTTMSAFEVVKSRLPSNVIYQFAPLDTPVAVEAFLGYWKPTALILLESELWPNLIIDAAKNGVALALLNARISAKSFQHWSLSVFFPLATLLLSKFSLIVPLSNMQAIQFQLLQAPPFVISFSGDLKYAGTVTMKMAPSLVRLYEQMPEPKYVIAMGACTITGGMFSTDSYSTVRGVKGLVVVVVVVLDDSEGDRSLEKLQEQLTCRRVWMASSLHRGEEKIMLKVHRVLKEVYPDIVTIIVPRLPQHAQQIAMELKKKGINVAVRSHRDILSLGTEIYIVDTLGELKELYRLTPIAVIGGSFLPGLAGHNISEAAIAGCAILTGNYVGHFNHMVQEMQRMNPSSVLQVSKGMLGEALTELLSDAKILEARRSAAKQAYHALSRGIIEKIWSLVQFHIFDQGVPKQDVYFSLGHASSSPVFTG